MGTVRVQPVHAAFGAGLFFVSLVMGAWLA